MGEHTAQSFEDHFNEQNHEFGKAEPEDGGRRGKDIAKDSDELHERYAGQPGTHGMDESDFPHYQVDHPSGWTVRTHGGPYLEVGHQATPGEAHEAIDVSHPDPNVGGMHPALTKGTPEQNHNALAAELHHFVQNSGEDYARHNPKIKRWQQMRGLSNTGMKMPKALPSNPGRVGDMKKHAHDSGDGETIYHCPFCFTGSTRYITKDGIKTLKETLGTTQMVLSADPDGRTAGHWVKAHIHSFGEQPIMKVTLKRNQVTKVVEATPEHRWIVKSNKREQPEKAPRISRKGKPRDWRPSECAKGHAFTEASTRVKKNGTRECKICAAQAVPVGGISRSTNVDVLTKNLTPGMRLSSLRPDGVGDLVPSDDGIRHGVVFGDGSAQGRYASVHLWGEKDKQLLQYFPNRRYKDVTTADRVLGTGVPGIHVTGDLWAWMKALPESDDPSYLYGWLAGYFAADGTVSKQGQVIINSANLAHLEAVRDIAIGLGISTYDIGVQMRVGFVGREPSAIYGLEFVGSTLNEAFFLTEQHRDRWLLRSYAYERFGWAVVSVESTGRTELVYCATVPETHSFALEGNIWVGNCGSGQVLARSDRTIECEFCHTCFTVQVQPEFSMFPQTINGMPVQVPGMPGQVGGDPGMGGPPMDEGQPPPGEEGAPPEDGQEGQEEPPEDDGGGGGNPFTSKRQAVPYGSSPDSLRTLSGKRLPLDDYMAHLAIVCSPDRERTLEQVRARRYRLP